MLLAQVYEVQHVLLETRTAEARAAFEKFGSKTRVGTNCLGHVLNVRAYAKRSCKPVKLLVHFDGHGAMLCPIARSYIAKERLASTTCCPSLQLEGVYVRSCPTRTVLGRKTCTHCLLLFVFVFVFVCLLYEFDYSQWHQMNMYHLRISQSEFSSSAFIIWCGREFEHKCC